MSESFLGCFNSLMMFFLIASLTLGLSVASHPCSDGDFNVSIALSSAQIQRIYENERAVVTFNLTTEVHVDGSLELDVCTEDDVIATVIQKSNVEATEEVGLHYTGNFSLLGRRLGETFVKLELVIKNVSDVRRTCTAGLWSNNVTFTGYKIIVLRRRTVLDKIFRFGIIVLICIIYVAFGCKIDPQIILKILKRPSPLALGIFCQFIIMPLLSVGIGQLLRMEDSLAFGLLAMGCSPGGGASNVWVNLLNGNLDLSISMTTISTFLSLGFMPLWIYALGWIYIDTSNVVIPYINIVTALLFIVIPTTVGIIIRKCIPRVGSFVAKKVRYISLLFIIWILPFGMYVNWYMYIIMGTEPKVIIAANLLPLLGYTCGLLITYLCNQKRPNIITIAIETGVQNASIPIILLMGNFPQPMGDLGAVMPVATALFYLFPILIAAFVLFIVDRRNVSTQEVADSFVKEEGIVAETEADRPEIKYIKVDGTEMTRYAVTNLVLK